MDRFPLSDKRWKIVKNWIIRQIETDEWVADSKLPSTRVIARLFETSISTVQRAFNDLETDAYVRTVPHIGRFVAKAKPKDSGKKFDFSTCPVNVNHAVVAMLSQAASPIGLSLSSAVLHPDLTPHVLLNKCLSKLLSKEHSSLVGLMPPPGYPALRRKIAGLMLTRGVLCNPEEILITSGDTVALELALEAIAACGATVAIETPTYYGILQTIERMGMNAFPIQTHSQSGIDLEHLEEALKRKKIDVIFLNPTLQNPRGFVMPDQSRSQISQLAREANVPIIEDDVFFDLVPKHTRPRAIKSYDLTGQTIYCSSFSKTLAPGYRVGWCVAGKYHDAILAQMFSRNLAVSSLAQSALTEFIGRGYMEEHCTRLRSQFSSVIDSVHFYVKTAFPTGTVYTPPLGGFVHWLELPKNTNMLKLEKLMSDRGYYIAGSGIFYPSGQATTGLRLCLGRALSPEVTKALSVLAECARLAQFSV